MTTEQKAKAYDEALKQAKFYHGNCPSEPERKKLEKMFPVLRESEDERIRKFLIDLLSCGIWKEEWPFTPPECVEYLEKQKGQKPAGWSEEDDALLKEIVSFFKDGTVKLQHDLNLYAGFLQNKFKSLRPLPKREWSEEDEENFKWFDKLFRAESIVAGGRDIPQDKYLWFKSFRNRPKATDNWKPSEEQMEAFSQIVQQFKPDKELESLYNDLTKL